MVGEDDSAIPSTGQRATQVEYAVGKAGAFNNGVAGSRRADVVRVGDIDFAKMRDVAEVLAHKEYDDYEEAVYGLTPSKPFAEIRREHEADADAAREAFGNHPWVLAVKGLAGTPVLSDIHEYWHVGAEDQRAAYVTSRVNAQISTWAVLMDGHWSQRGKMGWFGVSTDEMAEGEWHQKVMDLYENLDLDAWVVLVDCHI